MRKSAILALLLEMSLLGAGEDDWSLNNSFTVWADGAFYRRSLGHKHRLIIDRAHGAPDSCGNCHFAACDAKSLVKKFTYEPGVRAGMAYTSQHARWELLYFWNREWNSCCSETEPGSLYFSSDFTNDFLNDFKEATRARACYASWIQNGEVNYYRYVTPRRGDYFGAAWMAGVRYLFLAEEMEITYAASPQASLSFEEIQNLTFGLEQSTYHVHVWNNMPVVQVGAALAWNPTSYLSWDFVAKVGIGFDFDAQHTRAGDLNNTVVAIDNKTRGFASPFLADGMLSLTYQPWRFFDVHMAYQVIYLNGVALAPDQLQKERSSSHRLRANGMALMHGWSAGISFSF